MKAFNNNSYNYNIGIYMTKCNRKHEKNTPLSPYKMEGYV